jgi:hypothetical protein
MDTFLDRINSAPVFADELPQDFVFWVSVLVDELNENFDTIEQSFSGINDGLVAPQKTSAEIATLAATSPDGTMWYSTDHVPPVLVIKINGALRQVTTTAFP